MRIANDRSKRLVSAPSVLVSRAEGKLGGFLKTIPNFSFRGKTVLDIGSSTGGWTAEALARGASRVIAVEKGTGQMKMSVASNPRVELHEKTDVFSFKTDVQVDVILADVSFLSLTKVLKYAKMELASRETRFFVLLKPQFEARQNQLFKGVVKNEKIRREIVFEFENWLKRNGFLILKKRDSDIAGRYGNLERLYYLGIEK
jgi:23S rRNA (cytidine1920-2'-O)/16S rRNA (cytidine1409-2'-O)-methyltransferase